MILLLSAESLQLYYYYRYRYYYDIVVLYECTRCILNMHVMINYNTNWYLPLTATNYDEKSVTPYDSSVRTYSPYKSLVNSDFWPWP